jgi:hypothetical protein
MIQDLGPGLRIMEQGLDRGWKQSSDQRKRSSIITCTAKPGLDCRPESPLATGSQANSP